MAELHNRDRRTGDPRYGGETRERDPDLPSMRELDRRMKLWEMANGALCVLFLWAPMAAAAFHR